MPNSNLKHLRGALLVGGASKRMGQPKWKLDRNGQTLAQVLCDLLASFTSKPPLLLGQFQAGMPNLEQVADREQGAGPLSALLGLFDHDDQADYLILATDLYAMHEEALTWLLAQAVATDKAVIWPRFPDRPHGEPLAAIYRAESAALLEQAWSQGKRGPSRAVPIHCRAEPLIPDHLRTAFTNVNTPDELALLQQLI